MILTKETPRTIWRLLLYAQSNILYAWGRCNASASPSQAEEALARIEQICISNKEDLGSDDGTKRGPEPPQQQQKQRGEVGEVRRIKREAVMESPMVPSYQSYSSVLFAPSRSSNNGETDNGDNRPRPCPHSWCRQISNPSFTRSVKVLSLV